MSLDKCCERPSVGRCPLPSRNDIELSLVARDFNEFLKYVYLIDPPPSGKGHTKFERWPYMDKAIPELLEHRLIVWLKARQLGASWLLAAFALWRAQYTYGAKVVLFSQGQLEAKALLDKCRYIWTHLPSHLKIPLTVDNQEALGWGENFIAALPSTAKAGRSSNNTLVILDEADYHDFLSQNFYAVKPTLDDSGGQMILVSTANYTSIDSLFKTIYRNAPQNGFHSMFYPWSARPGRDEAWYEAKAREYPDAALFEKEYPATAEQALAAAQQMMAFDAGALEEWRKNASPPIHTYGAIRIWQPVQPGHRYTAFTDTSHGTGRDFAVTAVLDCTIGRIVADICNPNMAPDELAIVSIDLLRRYGRPTWAIEDNEWGVLTLHRAQELEYPRLYQHKEGQAGWHTNELTRHLLWGDGQEAVRDRLLSVPAADGIAQFYDVIRDPNKQGRIQAVEGGHDDYPFSVCGAWAIRAQATRFTQRDPHKQRELAAPYKW